jgi:hypothetical protein
LRIKTGLALTVLWLLARPGQAQTTQWTTQRYIKHSLRLSLQDAGFSEAIRASNPPDLDREVTSSQSGTSEYEFVAAYYFVDELNGVSLGPLHVSRFDNRTRRWTHSLTFSDDDARGSAQFVAIGDRFIIIRLHWTPSAGGEVVLDHDTLKFETLVRGFALSTGGSRIIFEANTVHFAPTHQAVLKEVEPAPVAKPRSSPAAANHHWRAVIDRQSETRTSD